MSDEEFVLTNLNVNKVVCKWLNRHGLECALPADIDVVAHKFTDFPLYALWDLIMVPSGAASGAGRERPNLDQLRAAIKGGLSI